MSEARSVVARTINDDPWLVSRCLPKDLYVPKEIHYVRSSWQPQTSVQKITAEEARAKGCHLDQDYDDETEVAVEVTEDVETPVHYNEVRLRFRGNLSKGSDGENVAYARRSTRPQKIRQELADAMETPLSYVGEPFLIQKIDEEISRSRAQDMGSMHIKPKVLVLLGLKEIEDPYNFDQIPTYTRAVFYIEKYSHQYMTLMSCEGQHYELSLDEDVFRSARIRHFVLFLPSNVQILSHADQKVLY